jgi:hypothetical protein
LCFFKKIFGLAYLLKSDNIIIFNFHDPNWNSCGSSLSICKPIGSEAINTHRVPRNMHLMPIGSVVGPYKHTLIMYLCLYTYSYNCDKYIPRYIFWWRYILCKLRQLRCIIMLPYFNKTLKHFKKFRRRVSCTTV